MELVAIGDAKRRSLSNSSSSRNRSCRSLSAYGEALSEQFDLVPARARVLQHVRFKYACRSCEGASHDGPAVVTAAMPAQPIPKSNASPGLAAHIVVSKFADGLPLYRQEGILARYMISVSRTSLACWMIWLGDLVVPLINLMHEIQLAYDVLQMDETSVQVLKEDSRAASTKSYMWVRRGGAPGQRVILFDYAPSRAGAIPMRLLDECHGYLQSDAYGGYNAAARRDGVIHVGCLDHARRKFVEAVKAPPTTIDGCKACRRPAFGSPAASSSQSSTQVNTPVIPHRTRSIGAPPPSSRAESRAAF